MTVRRRVFARAATVGLLGAALVAVGSPASVGAEPVDGFEVAELIADFETAPAGSTWQDAAVVVGDYVYLFQETEFDNPDAVRLWEYHVPSSSVRRVDVSEFDDIRFGGGVDYFGELVFGASRGAGGIENVLVKLTPGGVPTVVKVVPDNISDLAAGLDAVYFSVDDTALWSSDLTDAGTVEIATGLSRISQPAPAPRGDGTEIVYFEADGPSGQEPYRYDPGTGVTVFDVAAGPTDSRPGEFHIVDGAAYFMARSGDLNLYRLEGTDPGTITPELLQADVGVVASSGRRVFVSFAASGGGSSLAYFDHDGDALVTVVADFPPAYDAFPLGPSGALLAVGPDADESAVWYTDGTTLGTVEVRTTQPLALRSGGLRGGPDATGSAALFAADDGTGDRIWRYSPDPTLSSIDPTAFGAAFDVAELDFFASAQSDQWVFPAADDEFGFEPFNSGGTTATTAVIGNLTPGTIGSDPRRFAPNDGGVDFTVNRDSTTGSIKLISVNGDGEATELDLGLDVDDRLLEFIREPAGSYLAIVDRFPDPWLVRSSNGVATDLGTLGDDIPSRFVLSGDRLFFERSGLPRDRVASIRTDGTNLQELGEIGFEGAIPYAGGIVFQSARSVPGEEEPWFSDGTLAGTFALGDLRASRGSFPAPFFEFDGLVYFSATSSTWVTDGTPGGTAPAWTSLGIDELGAVGDDGVLARDSRDLFFVTSAAGDVQPISVPTFPNAPLYQFWQSNSTTSHAVSVVLDGGVTWIGVVDGDEYRATELDLGPDDQIERAVAHRGVAYYVVRRDDAREEIVRTDGTAAGTGVVWDQLDYADQINAIVLSGDRVFFGGLTEEFGKEVWSFDLRPLAPTAVTATVGTAAATVSWVAPTDDGSQPINGYTVTASPGGAGCSTTGATSCVVDGLTNGTAYTFTVTTTSGSSVSAPSDPSAPVTPVIPLADVETVVPGRLLDTRATGETVDDLFEKIGKVDADSFVELDVTGRAGVPADAGAVVLNVTMIRPDGNGFVTIYPCGDRPLASSMNAPAGGGVVANEVIAKVSATGTVCLYSSVGTNLAADVTGYVPTSSAVVSVEPARLLDTRATGETADGMFQQTGKVTADSFIELDVAGREGVPDTVGSVVLNVTMIRPDGNGFVTIYPCGDRPLASSMNAPAGGGVVANEVIAKVSPTGTVCLYSSVGTNLAADVTGYVPASSGVSSVEPARLLDTRGTGETADGLFEAKGKVTADSFIELDVLDRGGVPDSDVGAVVLNVTMIRPDGNGFVTIYPCGDRPLASSMNAPAGGGVVANEVIAKVSPTGTVCLYSSVGTNLAADITGYIST